MDDARVFIGDNVCIGCNASLLATNHPLLAQERLGLIEDGRMTMAEFAEDIHIGNNVRSLLMWLFWAESIGNNVVIGAGSVVTKDIPDNYLAFGVPCKPVRPITEHDSMAHFCRKTVIFSEQSEIRDVSVLCLPVEWYIMNV